jgi:hypothetical protein
MVDDIRDSKQLKNLGIDKDSIAQVGEAPAAPEVEPAKKAPAPAAESTPTPAEPTFDTEAFKKEILAATQGQIVDLAKQMQKFADTTEQRFAKIEEQIRNILKRENQDALKPETPKEPQQTLPKGESANADPNSPTENASFVPEDVSVEKMFNFSNTK